MIMINPLQRISLFIIRRLYRHLLPDLTFIGYISVFRALGSTSTTLISTIGLIPTLQLLNAIRRVMRNILSNPSTVNRTLNFTTVFNSYFPAFNSNFPLALQIIGPIINPAWKTILEFPNIFMKIYNIFMFITYLRTFQYLFKISFSIFKLFMGGVLSTLGILWSESLQTYSYLKDFAYFMKEFIENHTDIKIPTLSDLRKPTFYQYILPSPQNWTFNLPDNFTSSFLYYSGLLLGSGLLILGGLCYFSWNYQDLNSHVIDSINSFILNTYDSINNYFNNNQPDPGPQGPPANPPADDGSGTKTPPANTNNQAPDVNQSPEQPRTRSRSNSDSTVTPGNSSLSPILDKRILADIRGNWTDDPMGESYDNNPNNPDMGVDLGSTKDLANTIRKGKRRLRQQSPFLP